METLTQTFEVTDAVIEGEDLDDVPTRHQQANGGDARYYGAVAIWDVLDPYAAVVEGVPAPASKS